MLDVNLTEIIVIIVGLLAAGAVTGILAGVFGVGGGAVIVPVLYELFRVLEVPDEIRMPLAVGSSLAIIIPTSIRSFTAHHKRGTVDLSIIRVWAVPVVLGVVAGGVIARYAPADLFKAVFIVVAGVSALRLQFGKDSWKISDTMPGKLVMRLYGVLIGVLSSLMGIGGGQLSSLFMTFYGRPIHQAVSTSSGLGVLISIPGALGYILAGWPRAAEFPNVAMIQPPFALGFVSLVGVLLITPTSVMTAPIGVKIAHALPKRKLEVAFGCFLLLVSARFLFEQIAGYF
ncbi:sulfite exporter TauE/SafE family protein [Aminobacter sp. J44]|uniref:sulfite exporter TauE/SafE family protein n=1 Tax=Aminobacter sp. J44 TaxID=935262 RepID=UPI001199C274|nr:sulfite exporter TauE/SafE family protein [Aminobacter sp. J44]TWG60993.1 putative membrane protein YfcA [Aminobacter sp. J44]